MGARSAPPAGRRRRSSGTGAPGGRCTGRGCRSRAITSP